MMKKTSNHDVCSLFKSSISRTHKVLAASVVLAAGLLYGCSDSDVNEDEGTDPVESGIETQAITVNNNPASHANRITLYDDEGGARSRAAEDEEEASYKITKLAFITPPAAKDGNEKDQNLSATCVFPISQDKIYVCYHLNEEYKDNAGLAKKDKHQGAIELIEYTEKGKDEKPEAEVLSQLVNDYQDFNHCIVWDDMMYTTGDTEDGARLGRIKLNGYNFAEQDAMKVFKLKGGSGNCVFADDDEKFLIATNEGFQTVNPKELNENWDKKWDNNWNEKLEFFKTDASAKHITSFGTGEKGIFTLHLKDEKPLNDGSKENIATAVIQKGWGKAAKDLSEAYQITPTDGKNTIAICEPGVVYVCLGENGVVKLDTETGKELGKYCLTEDRPNYQGKACANGVAVDENYVYIAYGGYGLVVLDKTNMKRLARYAHKETVKDAEGNETVKAIYSANYVAVDSDGTIYVAYGRNGLEILKLEKKEISID